MTDYTELVKALRCNGTSMNGSCVGKKCGYYADGFCESMRMHTDAAAAIEELQAVLKEADKKQEYQHDYVCELVAEVEELKAQLPKRGEWTEIEDYDGDFHYQCSVCGEEWYFIDGTPADNNANYCPRCGAKMEVLP